MAKSKEILKLLIKKIQLQIQILQIQLAIKLGQKRTVPNLNNPNKIILHHGGGWLNFKGVNEWHKQRWGFKSSLGYYAGYQYFIERDGKIYQGRADNEKGAHTKGQNENSIGICLMGNGEEKDFTPEQYQSLKELLDKKRVEYNISKSEIYAHQDFAPTLCPSFRLYNWLLKYLEEL